MASQSKPMSISDKALAQARQVLVRMGLLREARVLGHTEGSLDLNGGMDHDEVEARNDRRSSVSTAVRTAAQDGKTSGGTTAPLAPTVWRKIRRDLHLHPPRQKRWLCCTKPSKRRTRKGKRVWATVCHYDQRSGKSRGHKAMLIVLSRNEKKRPKEVVLHGVRIRFCMKGQKVQVQSHRQPGAGALGNHEQ